MDKHQKELQDKSFEKDVHAGRRNGALLKVEQIGRDPLVWEQYHEDDGFWIIDLQRYSDGEVKSGIIGRPTLIQELAPEFRVWANGKSRGSVKNAEGRLTKFFRYLSEAQRDLGRNIQSCRDLESADGEGFKRYLLAEFGQDGKRKNATLSFCKKCAERVRKRLADHDPSFNPVLLWPTIERENNPKEHRDVDPRALKLLYNTFKRIHDENLACKEQGAAALAVGIDPRNSDQNGNQHMQDGSDLLNKERWLNEANLSVLFRERITLRILNGTNIPEEYIKRINYICGRNNIPSAQGLYQQHAPNARDAVSAYLLVSMHTGWMDTIRAITVADENFEECDDWYSDRTSQLDHAQDKRGTIVIFAGAGSERENTDAISAPHIDIIAKRPKTGRLHVALSLKRSRYHPYAVIKAQIERSRLLRDLLRRVRAEILSDPERARAKRADLAQIERKLKSPWIYYNAKGIGHQAVGLIGVTNPVAHHFNYYIRPAAIATAERRKEKGIAESIAGFVAGDIRDGYAAFIFDASFGNIFAVQQALMHRNHATTRLYLRQKRQIRERFQAFRTMTHSLFEEIKAGRSVDPTILYLRTSTGGVSDKDRDLLRDFRSRYGMSCDDPLNPPPAVAPNHILGTLCATQRCVLCKFARLTSEAIKPLACRFAELLELSKHIPAERFLTSSFQTEMEAIKIVREETYPELRSVFDRAVECHRQALLTGNAKVFDDVPLGAIASEIVREAAHFPGEPI